MNILKIVAAIATTAAVSLFSQPALAGNDLLLRNDSQDTMIRLDVSPSALPVWFPIREVSGMEPLESGRAIWIDTSKTSYCFHDVRVVFSDGTIVENYFINTCTTLKNTFHIHKRHEH